MKTLIVDDERLARAELRKLLGAHPQIDLVGEAANATEARNLIATLRPDLMFLDVQMPGETGFDLIASLTGYSPAVVFSTAFDEFALRAFEVNAFDYLLKPVDPARLASAIERVEQRLRQPVRAPGEEEESAPTGQLSETDQVFVREGEACWFVAVRSIHLLESEGNYTRLHFGSHKPLLYRSLNAMEERLPTKTFFRANRSQIINLTSIKKIEPWFSGGLRVELEGGHISELSRRQAQAFRERMSL
jgi:two-component system, LytTR family, response regulator